MVKGAKKPDKAKKPGGKKTDRLCTLNGQKNTMHGKGGKKTR